MKKPYETMKKKTITEINNVLTSDSSSKCDHYTLCIVTVPLDLCFSIVVAKLAM